MLSINHSALPADVKDGFIGSPEEVTLTGPLRLLRGAGSSNEVYSGKWWFPEATLLELGEQFDRIPMSAAQRREAILGRLRAGLAISIDWNTLSEIWLLDIPLGHSLPALRGPAKDQALFSTGHPLYRQYLRLRGGAPQFWIPVRNPLWVTRYATALDL